MTPPHPPAQEVWFVNASPFIGLSKAGLLHLLTAPTRRAFLPAEVAAEVAAGPPGDAGVHAVAPAALTARGIGVVPPAALDPRLARFPLDPGEAAVLTAVLTRPGSVAVIDDGSGRAAANALGVKVTGSLGVLIRGKHDGRLSALVPAVAALRAAGLFLPGDAYLRNLLASFGEAWP